MKSKTLAIFGLVFLISIIAMQFVSAVDFDQDISEEDKETFDEILEPVMKVEAVTPEEYMGDIMGDLNRRRGIVQGMEDCPAGKAIRAEVPLAEMFGYATDLRSMSQGRATYTMEFSRYVEVPANIAKEIIDKRSA